MKRSRIGLLCLSGAVIVTAVLVLMPFQQECGPAATEAFSKKESSGIDWGGAGERRSKPPPGPCAFPARQRLWVGGGVAAIGLVAFVLLRGKNDPQI